MSKSPAEEIVAIHSLENGAAQRNGSRPSQWVPPERSIMVRLKDGAITGIGWCFLLGIVGDGLYTCVTGHNFQGRTPMREGGTCGEGHHWRYVGVPGQTSDLSCEADSAH